MNYHAICVILYGSKSSIIVGTVAFFISVGNPNLI